MKIILSRKGFDSQYGGYHSPILSDGRLISLPIPSDDFDQYSNLKFTDELSYYDLMRQLKPKLKIDGKWQEVKFDTHCHRDPDIYKRITKRRRGWRGCFGQRDQAHSHLVNKEVGVGDLFLFFGWFKLTTVIKGRLSFENASEGNHVIFGYLQIGQIFNANTPNLPDWLEDHPHISTGAKENDSVYVAAKRLSWNNRLSGSGTFRFHNSLILTKNGQPKSRWDLPLFFRQANISYHTQSSWKAEYFQSTARGQEFVIEDNEKVQQWAMKLIDTNSHDKKQS